MPTAEKHNNPLLHLRDFLTSFIKIYSFTSSYFFQTFTSCLRAFTISSEVRKVKGPPLRDDQTFNFEAFTSTLRVLYDVFTS